MTAAAGGSPLEGYLARLDAAEPELRRLTASTVPAGALTDPDPPTGERWESGQVWAHMAEIIPYWITEARKVIDPDAPEPVPFGRVKTDAGRLAAIEERRNDSVATLAAKVTADVSALRAFLTEADGQPGAWMRVGLHSKLGEMPLTAIVEDFMVGHLEEHLAQLSGLQHAAGADD